MVDIQSIKKGGKKEKGSAEKQVKIHLTKEQRAYVEDLLRLDNRIVICREYISLWMQFFRFFAEDLSEKEVTPAEEKAFFQAMTQLARKHFLFQELMSDTFDRGPDIIKVLDMAVSLTHIQLMQENTRSKLELDWHSLFLDMNKALGRLLRRLPGTMTLAEALDATKEIHAVEVREAGKEGAIRSKGIAALLALPPMGLFGLHAFYLGHKKGGLLRLVTLGGLGLWALVDFFRILSGKMVDAEGRRPI